MTSSVGLPAMFSHIPPPVVFPAITEHKSTVIIVHGLGDSGNGYAPIVQNWQNNGLFQDTKFILPSAPAIPVTSTGGRSMPAWFDIRGERGPHVTFDALTAQAQDDAGLLRSRDYFLSLIKAEVDGSSSSSSSSKSSSSSSSPPIPASQVIMGGFSQGGVMTLLTAVSAEAGGLGGAFCLSGYLALADDVRAGEARGFPHARRAAGGGAGGGGDGMEVLMVHGDKDPIMNLEWAQKSAGVVKELGYDVDLKIVPGLGHSINQDVLAKVTSFIKHVQEKGRKGQHDEL
ncbi:hypothetical protein VSDG_09567 [Cytospora chrysosperma]|uniref:Acyl-protein thioesterase 1 n=1 Tax=Cytospora chrysosperma TaxID=252740 RepID=A0A423VAE2_CYTCH|nr:hypothetical protein VSDG_09567 [Valsa sordida]